MASRAGKNGTSAREDLDATPHIEASWRLIAETLHSGTMTLGDGTTQREIDSKQMVALVKWLASLNKGRKKSTIPIPEAFAKLV